MKREFDTPDPGLAQAAQAAPTIAQPRGRPGLLHMDWSRLGYWGTMLLIAMAYAAAARLSLLLAIPPGYATAVWPPSGIAVGVLMMLGVRYWPAIWLGATLANLLVPGTPSAAAALIGAGNSMEVVAVALLARRFATGRQLLHNPWNVARFSAIALAGATVAASVGVGTLFAAGRVPADALAANWMTWWLGDASSIVIITPLLLSWAGGAASAPVRAARGEYLAFAAVLLCTLWFIHGSWHWHIAPPTPLFVMFPVFAWAAMRLDQRALTAAGVLLALFSVFTLLEHAQELAPAERDGALLFMQLYVSTIMFAGLALSAIAFELRGRNAALESIADGLEDRVRERTRELHETSVELRALTAQVIKLQDEERRRLAAELHDIVGQTLGALAAELGLLRHRLRESGDDASLSGVDRANELAKQAMRSMRQVKTELHPLGIEVAGWPAILRWYGEAAQSRTGASVSVWADAVLPRPAAEVADALVRIYLEALSNAAKHAGARNIDVSLEMRDGLMVLAVADDGCGFDATRASVRGAQSGWGIAIMRERAAAIGGALDVHSKPADGTRVEVLVPLARWS